MTGSSKPLCNDNGAAVFSRRPTAPKGTGRHKPEHALPPPGLIREATSMARFAIILRKTHQVTADACRITYEVSMPRLEKLQLILFYTYSVYK